MTGSPSDAGVSPRSVLDGRRVVVCRPVEQAGTLLEAITELGGIGISLPLLEVTDPLDGGAALVGALDRSDSFDWIVLTSANAVRAVAARCSTLPVTLRLAVVGPATARAAAAVGWRPDFEPTEAIAGALALELPLDSTRQRVLAPLAELAADTLEQVLTGRGADVERVEAYRMVEPHFAVEQLETAVAADLVLLTSPSTADRFAALARSHRTAVGTVSPPTTVTLPAAVVIGPSTETAAIANGFIVLATADPHTEDGLLAALVRSIGA